jgi:hypothetical protein
VGSQVQLHGRTAPLLGPRQHAIVRRRGADDDALAPRALRAFVERCVLIAGGEAPESPFDVHLLAWDDGEADATVAFDGVTRDEACAWLGHVASDLLQSGPHDYFLPLDVALAHARAVRDDANADAFDAASLIAAVEAARPAARDDEARRTWTALTGAAELPPPNTAGLRQLLDRRYGLFARAMRRGTGTEVER